MAFFPDLNDDLFGLDLLLPEQYADRFKRSSQTEPHVYILVALLSDAITCYLGKAAGIENHKIRLRVEAERWFSGDYESPVTYVEVCEALDLEPNYIRTKLHQKLTQPMDTTPSKVRRMVPVHRKTKQLKVWRRGNKDKPR